VRCGEWIYLKAIPGTGGKLPQNLVEKSSEKGSRIMLFGIVVFAIKEGHGSSFS